jgi:hypothetical protein
MCKKLSLLACLVLLAASFCNAEDIQWTAGGRNRFWSTAANWDLSRPPTLADDVRIDVPAAAAPDGPVIQDGTAAQANGIFTEAAGEATLTMTGGTLEVAEWIWWGDGQDSFPIWTMSGGTVTVTNEFELGWGGGGGTLIMTGGTISSGEAVIPTDSGAFGELQLQGGTYNVTQAGGLEVNATGLIDITEGTLVLEGDDTTKVNDLAAAGLITAYGGSGYVYVDYDGLNAGKTTVTASLMPPVIEPIKPSDASLVAHYALDNDANDSSGHGLNGTIMGDPEFVEGVEGMALAMDGDGDIVDCGNDPNFAFGEAVTLTAWIKVNVQGVDHKVGGNQDNANGGYKMSVYQDKVEFEIRTAANSAVLNRSVEGGTILEADVWYHVAGVYSLADGYIRTYVDGALDRELLTTEELGVSPGNFYLGCEPFNITGYNFNGTMDEVRLYNTALAPGEVMYLAGDRVTPVDPGSDGLLAWWACDEGEGAVVGDISGNGRDGTFVYGDPAWVEGIHGNAVELVGPTLVEVPPLDMELIQATMAGWILPYGAQPDWSAFIMTRDPGLATGFNVLSDYQLAYHWNDMSESWSFRGGDMIAEDEWTFAAVTILPDRARFWVNGEAGSVNEITHGPCLWNSNIYLGGDGNDSWVDRRMNGALDDVVFYDRALTAGEISYLAGNRLSYTYDGDAAVAGAADDNDSLDGTWDHNNGSDAWDGTGIGDPDGAPGGASALVDEDGTTFLRIQDIGDPRNLGFSDPSNRKVYLTRETGIGLDGTRLEVRMRVATTPPLDDSETGPWPEGGIGYHIRDNGKGMVGISDGTGIISFSLAKAGEPDFADVATDVLVMNNLVGAEVSDDVDTEDAAAATAVNMLEIDDATQWNTFVIDIAAGGAGTHVVTVSANGGPAETFEVTMGGGTEKDVPYITVGSSGTGGITAFDVDYVTVTD